MNASEEQQLHESAVEMAQKAEKMKETIKEQTLTIEGVAHLSDENSDQFKQSTNLFKATLKDIDGDYRNKLIVILLILIIVLLYYLRT